MERSEFKQPEYPHIIHTNEKGGVIKKGDYVTTEPKPLPTRAEAKKTFEPLTIHHLVTPYETPPPVLKRAETIDMGKAPLTIFKKPPKQ